MKFPKWTVPLVLRVLSLAGLTSASGDRAQLMIGLALSSPTPESLSQPLSLDLDFFVQSGDQQLRLPIMPLHLLGKKSWNVYNKDNIEKVRRDEAIAKAKEEAEEQQMQELDAERRMQILRGEIPTPLSIEDKPEEDNVPHERRSHGSSEERKRRPRKRNGENETDFEMRVAAQDSQSSKDERQIVLRKHTDAPLNVHKKPRVEKNAEAEQEKEKKRKEYEDQYTMRFSNAAGFKQGLDKPWYSKATAEVKSIDEDNPGKDAWGNEDPRRKERDAARVISNDPLAAMRQGAAQVRQVKKEREQWMKEKEREVKELEAEERRSKRKRRHNDIDDDDLEGFSLDRPEKRSRSSHHRTDSEHEKERERRHRHRRRSERDESDRHRHRHRHHHRHHHRDE
ncbi:homocitrate synthase [Botrytis cinerea]